MLRDPNVKTVAVFNASEDTVQMLKDMLSLSGYRAVDGHVDDVKSGALDFVGFLEEQRPDAMIWDISPPYDRNWNFTKLVRSLTQLERCAFVVTTTHKQHLDDLAGRDTGALELVGKPYDLEVIVGAVKRALDANSVSQHPRSFRREGV
jgi:CheY-like chemotaxis protein